MNDKKKMAELIAECFHKCLSRSCTKCEYIDRPATRLGNRSCQAYLFADHLIANGVTVQEWIPASEPPTEFRDEYGELIPFLVCFEGSEYPFRAMYDGKVWDDGLGAIPITHWMPMPAPPKGE